MLGSRATLVNAVAGISYRGWENPAASDSRLHQWHPRSLVPQVRKALTDERQHLPPSPKASNN